MGSVSLSHGGYDDEEERRAAAECDSFTFMSCSDFASSSLRFLSDCEGGDSDSESYIEIELDRSAAKLDAGDEERRGGEGEPEEELQLRVSITSTVPFPKLCPSSPRSWKSPGADLCAASESPVLSGLSSSCSCAGIGGREEESGVPGDRGQGGPGGGAKFAAVSRLLTAVATSLKISPEISRGQDSSSLHGSRQGGHQQPPRSKEGSRTMRARNGARVMQFLFKFRAIQFRTFLASLMKSRPALAKGKSLGESSRESRLQETLRFHHKLARSSGKKSAETMASDKKTESCPSSIKCSPINQGTLGNGSRKHSGECSIQAAIAHCKKSFATSSDFSFKPHS